MSTARIALALFAAMASCHAARATSFDVRPVTIEAHGGAGSFTVTNPGDVRIYIETTVYDWTKDAEGRDRTVESRTAIASPPAMWLPPHASYLVRLRLPMSADGKEGTYRIAVQNVPDRSEITAGRVVFALTQNLPGFSEPDDLAPPDLKAHLEGSRFYIDNAGGRRARISQVSQNGKTLSKGLLGYALGGSKLGLDLPVRPGRVDVDTDLGTRSLDVR